MTEDEAGVLSDKLRRFFHARGVEMEDDTLDLTQDTFLRVLQKLAEGEQVLSLEGFTFGIAKNVFYEHCRRSRKYNSHDCLSDVELVGVGSPLGDALEADRNSLFRAVFAELPLDTQTLLTKRFVEEIPSKKIAQEEGLSVKTVDMRVFHAKREMKKQVEKREAKKRFFLTL